jgi:hypothetical protein
MNCMIKLLLSSWLSITEKYPVLAGTFAGTVNTTAVIWTYLAQAQVVLSILSLAIAITVGLVTLYGFYKKYKRGEF